MARGNGKSATHDIVTDVLTSGMPLDRVARKHKVSVGKVRKTCQQFAETVLKPPSLGEIALSNPNMFVNAQMPAYNPSVLVTRKGLKVFDEMRKDDQIKAALTFKKLAAIASGWEVVSPEQEDEEHEPTKFIKHSLDNTDVDFSDRLLEVLTALDFGYSISELVFKEIDRGDFSGKVGLFDVKTKSPHDMGFKIDDFGNIQKDGITQYSRNGLKSYPRDKFLVFTFQGEFGNPYGKSDLEACYPRWWPKENAYRWLAMLLERFGVPPIFALYDPSTYDEPQVSALRLILERLQAATSGAIPRAGKDSLELWAPELADQTARVFIPALNLYDRAIARALLMPNLLGVSPETGPGSFARSQTEFDVFMFAVNHLRIQLASSINKQIVRPLVQFNYGEQDSYPIFRFLPISDDLQLEVFKTWGSLVQLQVVKPQLEDESHIRQRFGFPKLEDRTDEEEPESEPEPEPEPEPGEEGPDEEEPEEDDSESPFDEDFGKVAINFDPDQPRADDGKWESGGGGSSSSGSDDDNIPAGHGRITPSTKSEVDALRSTSKSILKGLNRQGNASIADYMTGSKILNTGLRKGKVFGDSSKETIRDLDKLISRSSIPKNMVVYRGARVGAFNKLKVGDVVQDKAFISTSLDPKVANKFAKDVNARVIIRVPKGSKGLYVGDWAASKMKGTGFAKEKEVILQRESRFRVSYKSGYAGGDLVLDLINQPKPKKYDALLLDYVTEVIADDEEVYDLLWDLDSLEIEKASTHPVHTHHYRAPTQHEKRVDFKQIKRDLDGFESEMVKVLVPQLRDVRDRFLKFVKDKFDYDARFIRDMKPLRGLGSTYDEIELFLRRAYNAGSKAVATELEIKQEAKIKTADEQAEAHSYIVVKTPDKQEWCVKSEETGRGFGCYPSKKEAEDRLAQIERIKHVKDNAEAPNFRPRDAERYLKAKTFWITDVIDERIRGKSRGVLLNAIKKGEHITKTIEKLKGVFEPYVGNDKVLRDGEPIKPAHLETIIRTNLTDAFNQGRMVEGRRAGPLLVGFQYSAVIDSVTTPVCQFLDEKYFRPDDPHLDELSPPRHMNCRSILVPISIDTELDESDFIDDRQAAHAQELSSEGFSSDDAWRGYAEQPKTLYVSRRMENADEFVAWAKSQGFKSVINPDDVHVTVAFSRTPVVWGKMGDHFDMLKVGSIFGKRSVEPLGVEGAVVLKFDAPELTKRWQDLKDKGASWDFPDFHPHLTISYDAGGMDLSKVEPYQGDIFLGPERFDEVDEGWKDKVKEE